MFSSLKSKMLLGFRRKQNRKTTPQRAASWKPQLEGLEDRFLLSTYSTVILGDHPAAYYRLGETSGTTAFDSSGNSHDGTYLGGPTLGLPGALAGDPDTSVQFNGVSYTAGSIVDTNYSASDVSFTIEGWVRPTAAVAQEWVIAGRSGGGGALAYNAWDGISQPVHATAGYAGIAIFDGTEFDVTLSTTVLPLNQWTYLAGTWDDSTKNLDLYVNGVLDHQQTFPGKTSVVNAPLATFQIGASDETLHVGAGSYKAEYFQGGIDEVAYYSVALTSAQVQQHYMAAITTGPWTTVAPMPAARYAAAASAIGDILYVAGGEGSNLHETPTLQAYNAPTNTWTTLADMPAGRLAGDGAAVINGQLYVPGGWDNTYSFLPHSDLFVYDPGTNTWTSRASMPHLSAGGVSGVINGKLYVTTPDNGYSGYRNFLDVYDPVSDSWTSLAPSPHVYQNPAGGVIGGKLYVASGFDGSSWTNVLDVYDPATDTWTTKAPMPTAAVAQAASAVIGGKLYVVGGRDAVYNYLATVEVYDPATDSWTSEPSMPTARNGLAAGVVNGVLYAVGGSNASGILATNEAFTPLTANGQDVLSTEGHTFTGVAASFTDANPNATTGDFTASIDWGDGNLSTGTVKANASGGFDVIGSNSYLEEGTYAISVVITDIDGNTATTGSTATIDDAGLTATGLSISATEGADFSGVIASFTDADPNAMNSDFTATIDWGDGNVSDGFITANDSGGFDVSGTNTYAEEGTYTISVSIADVGASAVTASSTAMVADAALSANGIDVSSTEGASFTGPVAMFTDANPNSDISDLSATITWGDGNSSPGTIIANGPNSYTVSGTNNYAEEGSYSLSVTINDLGGSTVTATSMATVTDAALSALGIAVNATEGASFTGPVATFTDGNPSSDINDLSATITWGDGHSSPGSITANGPNSYTVSGTNTYAEEGSYVVSVVINDLGGSTVTATTAASVADASLSATGVIVNAIEGASFTGPVAAFTDANPNSDINDLTATIAWGDGHTSAGIITANGGNSYTVTGTNTYAEEGSYLVSVQIRDVGGSSAATNSTAADADAALPATFKKFSPIEGAPFTGVVATFRDTDPNGTLSDYVATITWGDGHVSAGKITPTTGAGFNVTGSNTYSEEGSFAVSVTIRDMGGSTASVGGLVKVVDAGLAVIQTSAVTATAGRPFSGRLATFIDADPNGVVADYTASIDWGDGHKSSGTITVNTAGGFDVSGANTYLRAGIYTIKILISDTGGSNINARTTATVSAPMAPFLSPFASGIRTFDSNQAALAAVLATWSSQNDYAARIANLLGTDSRPGFVNRQSKVFDPGAQDQLTGSAGQDWFFANLIGAGVLDKITGLGKDEIVTDI